MIFRHCFFEALFTICGFYYFGLNGMVILLWLNKSLGFIVSNIVQELCLSHEGSDDGE